MGGLRIRQQMVFIIGVNDVPIGNLAVDALAPLCLGLLDRADLLGSISRIELIEPVAQRRKLIIFSGRVHAVIDGDIAHLIFREDDLNELTGFQIITPQPRQILGDDSRHVTCLNLLEHFLQALPVKADAGKSIIHKKAGIQEMVFIRVPLENDFLILYAL